MDEPEKYVSFELPVKLNHTSFIDGYIEATHVLIEQKGRYVDLTKSYKQSGEGALTGQKNSMMWLGSNSTDKPSLLRRQLDY